MMRVLKTITILLVIIGNSCILVIAQTHNREIGPDRGPGNNAAIHGRVFLNSNPINDGIVVVTDPDYQVCYGVASTSSRENGGYFQITGLPAQKELLLVVYHVNPIYLLSRNLELQTNDYKSININIDINQRGYGTMEFFLALPSLANEISDNEIKEKIILHLKYLNTSNSDHSINEQIFKDKRDGNEYKTVKIGDQTWMAENLAYLPQVAPPSNISFTDPLYYVYDYSGNRLSEAKQSDFYEFSGVLYNWSAARNACPDGWHLPSEGEWQELEVALGMPRATIESVEWRGNVEGGKLKSSLDWKSPNVGASNSTGFGARPSGYCIHGKFQRVYEFTGFWSSTSTTHKAAYYRALSYDQVGIRRAGYKVKDAGYSVRCIKD